MNDLCTSVQFRAPRAVLAAEYPVAGNVCTCCGLMLPDELFPFANATHVTRSYRTCIACSRDCRGKAECNVGEEA